MRDYIDCDEEILDSSNSNEDFDDDENDEFYNMKSSSNTSSQNNKNKKNKKFDSTDFDFKVAKSISNIHNNAKQRDQNNRFSKWVNKNLPHLQALYMLSDLKCSPVQFYTYIYENSI